MAYDVAGNVVDELYWPPAPDLSTLPTLPTPPTPQLVPGCATAVNAETGEATCEPG